MIFDETALKQTIREIVTDVLRDQVLPHLSTPTGGDRLLTLSEAQDQLAVGWDTVDRLLREGELEAVQVRGHRKVVAASVQAYIDRHRQTRSIRAVS